MAKKAVIKSKALEAALDGTGNGEVNVTVPEVEGEESTLAESEESAEVAVDATETTETEDNDGEKTAPEEDTAGEVNVNPSAVAESEESEDKKNVRVKLIKDFNTFIGGKHWYFEKGKIYNVPENVKFVLNRAGLLAVL